MVTKQVGVGIIGAGGFGEMHARIFSEIPRAKLVGVADIVEAKAANLAKTYGADAYADYHRLLRRDDLDLVSITTPEAAHRDPAVAAAEAGKHLLVEKPLATTLKECDDITRAAKKANVTLMMGFENRFVPDYVKVKQYMRSGALGELLLTLSRRNTRKSTARSVGDRVTKDRFGGELLEEDIHDIDVLLWWADSRVVRVYAECVAKTLVKEIPHVEDLWLVTLRYENGGAGLLESAWVFPDKWNPWQKPQEWLKWMCDQRYEVVGSEGVVYLDLFPTRLYACDNEGWKFPYVWETYMPDMYGRIEGALKMELTHLVECVGEGKKPVGASGEDGRAAVQVALAAMESAEQGSPVTL